MNIEGVGSIILFRLLQGVFYSIATIFILFVINRTFIVLGKKPMSYKWWMFPLQVVFITMLFMFLESGKRSMGDYGLRLPIGYNYELQNSDSYSAKTFIVHEGERLLHPSGNGYETIDSFVVANSYLCGKSDRDFFILNLQTGEKIYIPPTVKSNYNLKATEMGLPKADSFTDFQSAYKGYYPVWQQWLLP